MFDRAIPHWRLTLAATLIAAQATILALGLFHAQVSPGYRSLFIDHTMMNVPYEDHTFVWPGPEQVPETTVPVKTS